MRFLVLAMILGVTLVEFMSSGDKWKQYNFLPSQFGFFPELTSLIAALVVLGAGAKSRFAYVRPAYWIVLGSFVVLGVAGIFANDVNGGPVFAALRTYLRSLPWFLLAAAVPISEKQLGNQLKWLLGIALLQIPIAIQQRIRTGSNYFGKVSITGDWTMGTMQDSGVLTVFLLAVICVLVAAFVRKRLNGWLFLLLFVLCLIPTAINETKVTVLMLPAAVLATFMVAAESGKVLRQTMLAVVVLGVAFAIFVPTYNALMAGREYSVSLTEFFTDSNNWSRYLSSDKGVGATGEVGRLDALAVPTKEVAQDPVTLMLGHGPGNASVSALGEGFGGKYDVLFEPFLTTTYSRFILEFGLLGVLLLYAGYWLVFQDARAVAREQGTVTGYLAAAWVGVTVLALICTVYIKIESFSSLNYLYAYFSGIVMAERMRQIERSRVRAAA